MMGRAPWNVEPAFLGSFGLRSLDPGTYYAIISDASPGELSLEVEFSEPLPVPTNQTCDGSIDLGTGGETVGSFVDVTDDYQTGCGPVGASDLVYELTTAASQNVEVTLVSRTGGALAYALQDHLRRRGQASSVAPVEIPRSARFSSFPRGATS